LNVNLRILYSFFDYQGDNFLGYEIRASQKKIIRYLLLIHVGIPRHLKRRSRARF